MSTRREFLKLAGGAALTVSQPGWVQAQQTLPTRPIPGTDDELAIIGLGNSNAFRNADRSTAEQLLDIYLSRGGNYIDVGGSSAYFVGELGQSMDKTDQIFLGNYIDPGDASAMRSQARALAQAQGKPMLDLVHTMDVNGYLANPDAYRALKDEGLTRFVGVAKIGAEFHAAMADLVEEGLVDFIQVNYSMLEPQAGERLLPLALDNGVGVAISRPFLNGNYFSVVSGHELPAWAAEFDCETWAQFSLKYILGNPAVNCALTETANPAHAIDNIGAGFGRLPDNALRRRMRDHLLSLA